MDTGLLDPLISAHAPGAVVSVRQRGRTLLRRGYGLAHIDSGLPNTPAVKMRIGSTSKHMLCLLLLQLRDEGRLSLGEPMARWIPELPEADGRRTLYQLMTHTGGMRDFLDLALIAGGLAQLPDGAPLALQCRQRECNFAAGTAFAYSNGGYRLLSLAVERLLGQPLAEAMQARLFEPLAMFDTALWPSDLAPLPGLAQTHLAQPGGRFAKGLFPCTTLGEGGVVSTVDDMQRWMAQLLASPWLAEMTRPSPMAAYGLGLIAETTQEGLGVIHHAGGMVGGNSQMLMAPALDLTIAVHCNRSDLSAPEIAQQLLRAAAGIAASPPAPPAAAALEGCYFNAEEGRLLAIERSGEHLILRNFGMPLPLRTAGDGLRVDNAVLALALRPLGNALALVEQGRRLRCERVALHADLSAFEGRWHSEDLDASVLIADGRMTVHGAHGRHRLTLHPGGAEACFLRSLDLPIPFGATLRLAGSGELQLDTTRTRRLRLRRAQV